MTGLFAGPGWLFCPADRPDRFAKAAAAADVVILDLEDGVAAADREAARRNLSEVRLAPDRTVVRINPAGSPDHVLDLAVLAGTDYRTLMLAKTESADDVRRSAGRPIDRTDPGSPSNPADPDPDSGQFQVIALCETALGVLNAVQIAAEPATVGLMWGAEDLLVSLGGRSSRHHDGGYRDVAMHARSQVLLAAAGHRKTAIDSVFLDFTDLEGLRGEAADAAASGFAAKACIHPTQVAAVREVFVPSTDELIWAARVLRAARGSAGVFAFEGKMVDEPVLALARRLIAAAGRPGAPVHRG